MKLKRIIHMNKKGLKLKKAFFAAIVFGMVIIAVGTIIGEWNIPYNSGISYDLEEYSDLDTFSEEANLQKERITPQSPETGSGDFEGQLFRGGYGLLGRIFLPFRTTFNMFESIENRFGLPSWIGEGALTLIFFAFITALVVILFRLPGGST